MDINHTITAELPVSIVWAEWMVRDGDGLSRALDGRDWGHATFACRVRYEGRVQVGKAHLHCDGNNVVILQEFKEFFALGFFQGALLKDPKKLLVQLGQTQAGRVMKFAGAEEITSKAATIRAYVSEAMAIEKAGLRVERRRPRTFRYRRS